jgi:hypothetical protein
MIAGGLVVVAGAKLDAAQRVSADGGFSWSWMDRARAWRGVGGLTAVLLFLAVLVPGLPPLVSRQAAELPQKFLKWMLSPTSGSSHPSHHPTAPPPVAPTGSSVQPGHGRPRTVTLTPAAHAGFFSRVLRWPADAINAVFGNTIVREGLPIVLTAGLVVLVIVMIRGYWKNRMAAGADWRTIWERLWDAFRQFFEFWQWLRGMGGLGEERLREATGPGSAQTLQQRAGAVAAQAGTALAGLMDPRRVVRASYRRFLRTAAGAGRARELAETPADYALRLEEFLGDDAAQARELTRAYEEARYSDHVVGAGLAGQARAALGRLVHRLGGLSARLFGGGPQP